MKKSLLLVTLICTASCLLTTGCRKKSSVWDDDQTAGNYKGSNGRTLWGNNDETFADEFAGPDQESFIGLKDEDLKSQFADGAIPQPKHSPGEFGSGLPGIDGFHSPTGAEASLFSTLYFNTDDHILRGQESLAALDNMAKYMKAHPGVAIFVSGHCDERGPEAYNLSLGARRANYIRTKLAEKGVDANRVHTISYGKERPMDMRHDTQAWNKNRRAEFKIFQKS